MLQRQFGYSSSFVDHVFCTTLAIASQVWARLHIPLQSWPLRLLSLDVHKPFDKPRVGPARDVLVALYNDDGLDEWLSEQLRMAVPCAEWNTDQSWYFLVRQLRRHFKHTNMNIERLSGPYNTISCKPKPEHLTIAHDRTP